MLGNRLQIVALRNRHYPNTLEEGVLHFKSFIDYKSICLSHADFDNLL